MDSKTNNEAKVLNLRSKTAIINKEPKESKEPTKTIKIITPKKPNEPNEPTKPKAPKETKVKIINKGTGAGGANTNNNGKSFEALTNNQSKLIEQGYEKHIINKNKYGYYYKKQFEDKEIVYVLQAGFKTYMNKMYNIDNAELFREPDEAYIITYKTGRQVIKFVEAKTQNVEGSVDIKLLAAPIFVEEYKMALDDKFEIEYLLCLDTYFQKEFEKKDKKGKYRILEKILEKFKIPVLFGKDSDYFEKLNNYIMN
jgi:hypothetical protein